MSQTAELTLGGKSYELPVIEGSEAEKAVDISKLRGASGLITIDPGFKNTGSTQSAITFLDGEKGILRYRGYPIEQLAEKSNFIEVAYLLVHGELPTQEQLSAFEGSITEQNDIPEEVKTILEGFPKSAHPMGVLSAVISALTAFYPEALNPNPTKEEADKLINGLIGKLPTIISWAYKMAKGESTVAPSKEDDYCTNFLKVMFSKEGEDYKVDPVVVDALNTLLILHADHEQNCSTATVRVVGSSHASLYSAISAGVSALWGPLHGGANQAVIEMLEAIKEDGGDTKKYLAKAKDKNDPFRLMGFGHRVYKNFDPRARIIKKSCDEVLAALNINDPVLDIAKGLEQEALNDEYFKARNLYPNVDFYSGIIYRALGLDVELFTVMFALGRLPGWIAQWKEMREDNAPIGRPRQVYTGATERDYTEVSAR
ncbi:MAG: citrate synthase [Cytophagales bacterium]|nr:citrate synthase [Cytophagales bacterium]